MAKKFAIKKKNSISLTEVLSTINKKDIEVNNILPEQPDLERQYSIKKNLAEQIFAGPAVIEKKLGDELKNDFWGIVPKLGEFKTVNPENDYPSPFEENRVITTASGSAIKWSSFADSPQEITIDVPRHESEEWVPPNVREQIKLNTKKVIQQEDIEDIPKPFAKNRATIEAEAAIKKALNGNKEKKEDIENGVIKENVNHAGSNLKGRCYVAVGKAFLSPRDRKQYVLARVEGVSEYVSIPI